MPVTWAFKVPDGPSNLNWLMGTSHQPIIQLLRRSHRASVGAHAHRKPQFAENFRYLPGRDLRPYKVTAPCRR